MIPFYRLEKAGGFRDAEGQPDPRGAEPSSISPAVGVGAAELRDMLVSPPGRASGEASIGWPAVKVAEVEAGTADPWLLDDRRGLIG